MKKEKSSRNNIKVKTCRTQYSYNSLDEVYESDPNPISKTEPDKAYTVRQIFDKFRAGVRLNIERSPIYSDTDDFDHISAERLDDITDYHEVMGRIRKATEKAEASPKQRPERKAGTEFTERQTEVPDFAKDNA